MMKSLNYPIISSLCAMIIGILLVVWPGEAVNYLVMTIGVLFMLPGLMGLVTAFTRKEVRTTALPVIALGSTLLGMWLIIMPGFFVGILMYVLGVLLVLAGLSQLSNLIVVRSELNVPWGLFVIPVLVLAAGLVVLFNPFEAAAVPFMILGASAIVYSLTDLVRLLRYRRKSKGNVTDVDVLEETVTDDK